MRLQQPEDRLLNQWLPRFWKRVMSKADTISGATITSQAIQSAVRAALTEAGALTASAEDFHYQPGTYTGTAGGRGGDLTVEVVVTEDTVEAIAITGGSLFVAGGGMVTVDSDVLDGLGANDDFDRTFDYCLS